jgi:hypothetical protein
VNSSGESQGRFLVMSPKPFLIRSVEGSGDGFHVSPIEPISKTVHVVTFTYRPEEATSRGDLRHVFRVETNLPGEPPVEVATTLHVDP